MKQIPPLTDSQKEYFWDRVIKTKSCWRWSLKPAALGGYGHFTWKQKRWRAHRIAYFLKDPNFDQKLLVLHKCDNPICVNPSHLFAGTYKDNCQDMCTKKRQVKLRRDTCSKGHKYTEENTEYPSTTNRSHRRCIKCARETHRRYRRRKKNEKRERLEANARRVPKKTVRSLQRGRV